MGWFMDLPTFRLLEFESSTEKQRAALTQNWYLICWDEICLLENHDIAKLIIAAEWQAVTAFFVSPADKKQKVAAPYAGYPYGWLGPYQEALAASKGEKYNLITRKVLIAAL